MKQAPMSLVVFLSSMGAMIAMGVVLIIGQVQVEQELNVEAIGSRDLSSIAAAVSSEEAQAAAPTPTPTPDPSAALASPTTPPVVASRPTAEPSPSATEDLQPIPIRVKIPELTVDSKIVPVGLAEDGAIEIPEDVDVVGWYELGVAPGHDQGSAVLVNHRDGRGQGHGAFYSLGNLGKGDVIEVYGNDGSIQTFKVIAKELISKKRLPIEELFAIDGPPRLTLLSCGGYYDRNNGGYQDNIVITAIKSLQPTASASPSAS